MDPRQPFTQVEAFTEQVVVIGSAHCALGPFWSERRQRDALRGCQVLWA